MDNHAKIRSGCNVILPTRPTWRDQDQVRCCSAEIGMGSIVCVTVRSLQFQYRHPDTYILEPPFGLQTSLVYICGTFSSIIHYSVRLLNSLIVTPPNNYFCTLGAKATLFFINAILPCRISQVCRYSVRYCFFDINYYEVGCSSRPSHFTIYSSFQEQDTKTSTHSLGCT